MDYVPRLEVHYYLQDELHSMDAMVRNRCEAEFLAAVSHITQALGVELRFEATIPEEGGFRDIWRVVASKASNPAVATILIQLLTLAVTQAVNIWIAAPKPNPELEKQQLEINKLTIDHWKLENRRSELEVQKLERESSRTSKSSEGAVSNGATVTVAPVAPSLTVRELVPSPIGNSTTADSSNAVRKPLQLQMDSKVVTRRSNFYKQLLTYEKVTAVGFLPVLVDRPVPDEAIIERSQFNTFIMQTNALEPEVREAIIEIVSPVISEGNMKWKGRSNGEVISFAMSDRTFKQQVFRTEVSFQHGDSILCVLETDRKLDEVGNETVTGYRVTTVLDKIDGSGTVHETAQGRRKRFADKQPKNDYPDLFGPESV
ncbi:hypothetical protein PQR02_37675 [Paraburkholderia sediminicola]|uniref:Uncharacterized protein n=1 Tax=Paraburkholderia rhynchosiae TaxID=487049 RepID=A0ACC7NUK3_9BURK